MVTEQQKEWMREAIALSSRNVDNGGGPFGAVIVKDGEIIARGANRVTADNDPTAHAEVSAIRAAAKKLGTFDLSGCDIYTSCEPCPMCLSAIYWARIGRIYYGNTQYDAKAINFDDSFIYDELSLAPEQRAIPARRILGDEAIATFNKWRDKEDKIEY
jgi:tRNA(Arg) A34 adenosine deaminase TadA